MCSNLLYGTTTITKNKTKTHTPYDNKNNNLILGAAFYWGNETFGT